MYRTDKQFMTNPATACSRIYIGSIPKTVVASDLEEKFQVHGNILGLVLQMGFAFIQFENDAQAQAAIQNEHQSMLHGRKIVVKQALDKSQKASNPNQFQNKKVAPPPSVVQHNVNQPPLHMEQPEKPQIQPLPLQLHPNLHMNKGNPPPPVHEEPPVTISHQTDGGPPEKRSRKRRMRNERFPNNPSDMYCDEYYGAPENYPPTSFNAPPVIDQPPAPDRNDCEIIVVSKPLTKYAEYIEQRLKTLGLIVDLLFPNEDVPIGRVLANISSRGCLYAILVMPQNEEHRSLTLNVLHGIPQEHRNMPLEDALILITRNFDAYMRGDKNSMENHAPGQLTISDRHPSSMQLLLNLLAENRQVTSSQYEKLLKYLQERREIQLQHELAEGIEQDSQESNSKQAELQSRIMNILNKSATENAQTNESSQSSGAVAAAASAAATAPPPLLKDPSVQKALDSLLGGEMFKNIAAAI